MSKLSKFVCASVLVFSSLSLVNTVNAEEQDNQETVIYEKKEIKDLNKLYERAENNVTDKKINIDKLSEEVEVTLNDKEVSKDVSATTQLLKKTKDSEGNIDAYYTTTTFVDDIPASEEEASSGEVSASATSTSRKASKWDSSGGVKAYSTVYYSVTYKDSVPYQDLSKVTGGWSVSDSSISLSNRKVDLGQSGGSLCGGVTQKKSFTPSGNTFSYPAPSSWCAVSSQVGSIGANTSVTLKRGSSSTWTLSLPNRN